MDLARLNMIFIAGCAGNTLHTMPTVCMSLSTRRLEHEQQTALNKKHARGKIE